ncbi:hypothetical protein ACJIZ3_009814 [Penstemon smallii]|uniref:ASCH domain-containing protein n=1 Tax=Penstemon smallii TaxID=265156 RepID=A0ABD3TFD3_9LAMI
MDTQPPVPESASSPGVPPVQVEDCIEEVLKLTLLFSIKGKLIDDIGLSNEYCAKLLEDDPFNLLPTTNEVSKGVPSYPLYKRLASSLNQSIHSGAVCTQAKELIPVHENLCFTKKEDKWNELIAKKGHALLSMLKKVDFELHVQDPFFLQLADGLKNVEGRCAVGDYQKIESGDLLVFNKCLMLQVQDVHHYASFREMLEAESLAKVLPGVISIEEGVQIYRNFYSEEKERSNGVVALCLKSPTSQLYDIMASLLSGLSYEGIQKLLGFVQTIGTNPELLPPPTSTLLSTFLAPHNPDLLIYSFLGLEVKGSTLTDGARALAKHVNRSSKGFWGLLHGNDSEKNQHAEEVISHLLTCCSWLNMHIVPPHGVVFEIRTADGYGARWSEDGTKFIGFLEPYMVDGHSKGWMH